MRLANESEERAINLANAKIQLPSQREAKSDQGRNGLKARGNGLDFLGYNFSLALAAHGPKRRYWRVAPSKKSVQTRDSTTASDDLQPTATYTDYRINRTAQPLNLHLRGWKTITASGIVELPCSGSTDQLAVENRLRKHLRRRSQRPWRIPEGSTLFAHLLKLGLVRL